MTQSSLNRAAYKRLQKALTSNLSPVEIKCSIELIEKTLNTDSRNVKLLTLFAQYQLRNRRPDIAGEACQRALQQQPCDQSALALLLHCYNMVGDSQKAYQTTQNIIVDDLRDSSTLEVLAATLVFAEDYVAATAVYKRLTTLYPRLAEHHTNLGAMLHYCHCVEDAEEVLLRAIKIDKKQYRAYWLLSQLRVTGAHNNHITLFTRQLLQTNVTSEGRVLLNFALAKEREDQHQYDLAFEHLKAANQLKFDTLNYRDEDNSQVFRAIRFGHQQVMSRVADGYHSHQPIFIVGMPRTGTTLVEQVIAADAKVYAAGELQDFFRAMCRQAGGRGGRLPIKQVVEKIVEFDFEKLGRDYIDLTKPRTSQSCYFIDKLPENFLYLGAINKALPNARIIHMTRDPMDTCLSNYKTLFSMGMYPHSYSLEAIVEYYRYYAELMAYWNESFGDAIVNVRYEKIVSQPNEEFTRIFNHCRLEWDSKYLDYHKAGAAVGTASAAQVRQPIYSSSVEKWRHYEPHLKDFAEKLAHVTH